ncbi:unnamed protein product [Lactuca saligna]|uniref:Uncharacterized protein n=1 Tax=Lactuca saligna TaxID=75948 RepID=A0AA35YQX0_LACSI|nr:unnamed protein product [Lactuca saligna]
MKLAAKLDDLVAKRSSASDYEGRSEGSRSRQEILGGWNTNNRLNVVDKHLDVHEDEGFITIPCKELPDDWNEESDMLSFKSFDRSFVFPGEQIHILATLSTNVAGDSALSKEKDRVNPQELLKRFRNSHFFARIAESDEVLWSKRKTNSTVQGSTAAIGGHFLQMESSKDVNKNPSSSINTSLDRESLDTSTSGGVAKNDVKCSLLPNGDIVDAGAFTENLSQPKEDPYGDLLKWLLPVKNSTFLSSFPETSHNPNARSSLTKPNSPSSFGSQNFLLGHFRSHSMSSIPSKTRSNVGPDDWNQIITSSNPGIERNNEELLSFRGVLLEPERFSVCCGLEGIYIPGRRWRRKIEIIKPLEIRCFAAECNTEDLLCVQIKNVSPPHAPDIVIYLDSISVICEESSKDGTPSSLPITCIEAGNNHGLPGLPLRKGEEHSFILKPVTSISCCNAQVKRSYQLSQLQPGSTRSSVFTLTNVDRGLSPSNRYALLISCTSNYTESRLFFKQPTNWQPHIQKDILISVSVASQTSRKTLQSDNTIPNLPIQVLTLEASNLTNEALTLTLVAPPSFTSSMVSLNYSPASPMTPFDERVSNDDIALHRLCSVSKVLDQRCRVDSDQIVPVSNTDIGRTHMWFKSTVPLGCVPGRSTVSVKLELLPLTDGIITLDSLQINVEKGISYVPEHPLKIKARSPIKTEKEIPDCNR